MIRRGILTGALMAVFLLMAGQVRPVPAAPGAVGVPPAIPADCSVDVTGRLNAWIGSVPDNSVLQFPQSACYRVDDSLRIEDRHGLVFEGNGVTFKVVSEPDPRRRHIAVYGGGDLVFRNLTVQGAHPNAGTAAEAYQTAREFQHAFALQGVEGALLERVRAFDVYGDFVYIGPDTRPGRGQPWSRRITVQNSTFERNGRQGISVVAGEDVLISGNRIGEVRRATFDLEPTAATWGARRVRIVNNTTGAGRLLWLASGGQGANVSDITITGNVMQASTGTPVVYVVSPTGARRGPFLIEHNTFIVGGSPAPGFRFVRVTGVMLRDNRATFPPNRAMVAVGLEDAQQVVVRGNAFCGAAQIVAADDRSTVTKTGNVTSCP
jgi:hypothetical protein